MLIYNLKIEPGGGGNILINKLTPRRVFMLTTEINTVLVLCLPFNTDSECPIYANMPSKANCQPSPRPAMPAANLKTVSSSQKLNTPSPSTKYDADKRRHKQ